MIGITPEKVLRDIAATCTLAQFNDHIRSHFIDEADLSAVATQAGATRYVEARRNVAEPLQWKVFSHCASVTRLYALYEGFVYELISAWLTIVPSLYGSYARLPEAIIKQHRVGVGVLLQKLGGGSRTEKLTELSIVQPIFSGLNGQQSFTLIPDAFFIDLRNLRHDELCGLFKKVSLDDLGSWLAGHTDLKAMCDEAGTTPVGRLTELIDFRNEASHAREEIDETLGVSAFQDIADFIQALCVALHQFVIVKYIDVLQNMGRLELLGKITEFFPRPEAAILTTQAAVRLSVGDEVIARGRRSCISVQIADLQDHDQGIETIDANAGDELGVRFSPTVAKEGVRIFRLRPANSPDGGDVAVASDASAAPPADSAAPVAEAISSAADAAPASAAGANVDVLKAGGAWNCVLNALHKLRQWFHR